MELSGWFKRFNVNGRHARKCAAAAVGFSQRGGLLLPKQPPPIALLRREPSSANPLRLRWTLTLKSSSDRFSLSINSPSLLHRRTNQEEEEERVISYDLLVQSLPRGRGHGAPVRRHGDRLRLRQGQGLHGGAVRRDQPLRRRLRLPAPHLPHARLQRPLRHEPPLPRRRHPPEAGRAGRHRGLGSPRRERELPPVGRHPLLPPHPAQHRHHGRARAQGHVRRHVGDLDGADRRPPVRPLVHHRCVLVGVQQGDERRRGGRRSAEHRHSFRCFIGNGEGVTVTAGGADSSDGGEEDSQASQHVRQCSRPRLVPHRLQIQRQIAGDHRQLVVDPLSVRRRLSHVQRRDFHGSTEKIHLVRVQARARSHGLEVRGGPRRDGGGVSRRRASRRAAAGRHRTGSSSSRGAFVRLRRRLQRSSRHHEHRGDSGHLPFGSDHADLLRYFRLVKKAKSHRHSFIVAGKTAINACIAIGGEF